MRSFQIDSSSGLSSGSSSTFTDDWIFLFHLFLGAELGHKVPGILILMILGAAIGNVPEKKNVAKSISSTNKISNLIFRTDIMKDKNSEVEKEFVDKLHSQIRNNSDDTTLINDISLKY